MDVSCTLKLKAIQWHMHPGRSLLRVLMCLNCMVPLKQQRLG